MTPPPAPQSIDTASQPVAVRFRIDDACSAFEAAFARDPAARVEPFVPPAAGPERTATLAELIQTERECRAARGDAPRPAEYLARFPADAGTVRTVFADAPLEPGDRLGRYVVRGALGAGGMGVVYLATDELVGRPVALKVLSVRYTSAASVRDRLVAEARSAGRVSHPNVVTLYEAGDADGRCFLAMEYMAGGSAGDRLRTGGPFPWREAVAVAADVCRGLVAAHAAALVHLDVKPANILLPDPGDGSLSQSIAAKVSDFGLARGAAEAGEAGRVAGTPKYMAPEQTEGRGTDPRTDVYGVGATLYALLTGTAPPPGGADPRGTAAQVPEAVARVVVRCLRPAPEERYASAAEVLAALEAALRARPKPPARWRLAAPIAAVAAVLAIAGGTWFLARPPDPPEPPAGALPGGPPGPWEPLFDGKTLAGWEVRPGNAERVEPTHFKAPEGVFSVVTIDGGPAIRCRPSGHWMLTTTREFENYQLRLEYRWGDTSDSPRPNSGIMYHYRRTPINAGFERVTSHEFDIWPPDEVGRLHTAPNSYFDPAPTLRRMPPPLERPAPQWNRLDLLCPGESGLHVVNGQVAADFARGRLVAPGHNLVPYTSGRIQLQSYFGEIYFRKIEVRTIHALSAELYR